MSNYVNLLDIVYPVGSIYVSMSSTSPSSIVGGTWTQIKDKFLRPTGKASLEEVGGEHSHTFVFRYASYYGIFPTMYNASPDDNMLVFDNSVTVKQTSEYGHQCNNAAAETWKIAYNPTTIKKTVTTSAEQDIPASITCYCWHRTA